ncbi:hypothetical protein EVC23_006 [Rhizobium phage RHph_N3_8]|uniref:hypothetical protein n=1 Tax=Rhizobium phage RHph_N3_8 TaxID=2509748 RepID=UPI001AF8AE29|nr:hypothetical protein QEJ65_gp06 [Rhizobium phage RHph_N3_8]QIG76005.1 hypothetical protein EVC23_006 [Rhizobium phage RHph_N3_8]
MGYNRYIGTRHNERHVMADQDNASPVASIYRATASTDALRRMHVVTTNDFPISGDSMLRHHWKLLEAGQVIRTHPEHLTSVAKGYGPFPKPQPGGSRWSA